MLYWEHRTEAGSPAAVLTLAPNRSISAQGLLMFFGAVSFVALAAAGYFALHGLWVPLPLAGLELTALGLCLWYVRKRDNRAERVEIASDAVCVLRRGRRGTRRWDFSPAWTRVRLARGAHRWYPKRLLIGAQGNELELGAFLNDDERNEAATKLRSALAPVSLLR